MPGITGGDGSADAIAADAKEAGPKLRFCQTVDAQFCADFDTPGDAGAGFLPPSVSNGFTLDYESAQTKSFPVAVKATEPGDGGGMAYLGTALGVTGDAGASTTIALDLDIYLPALTVSSSQALFAFVIGAAGPQFQWGLASEGKGIWRLENLQTSNGPQLTGTIATGEWAHANLTITLSNTNGSVTCTVTSSAGTATTLLQGAVTAPGVGPLPVLLNVGLQSNGPANQAGQFLYDNVVVHYQ